VLGTLLKRARNHIVLRVLDGLAMRFAHRALERV
jgi:hypothetical protein